MEVRCIIAAAGAVGINALAASAMIGLSAAEPLRDPRVAPLTVRLLPPPEQAAAAPRPDAGGAEPIPSAAAPAPAHRPPRIDPGLRARPAGGSPRSASQPALAAAARNTPPVAEPQAEPAAMTAQPPAAPLLPPPALPASVTPVPPDVPSTAAALTASPANPSALAGPASGMAPPAAVAMVDLPPAGGGPRVGPRIDANWAGNAAPPYPASARRLGEQGEVRLDVHVGADGGVLAVRLRASSGSPTLDRSAIDAVRRWRFTPATVDGRAIAEWYHDWRWVFRLEG